MTYTTTELITGAYYATGVISREFETVTGTEQADGLIWLNEIIAEKAVDEGMIPYESKFTFNATQGMSEIYIPDLVHADTLVFFINDVRYSMQEQKRNQYFGSDRVTNIETLPYLWHVEREFGGARLFIYFEPNQTYPMELWGTFRLSQVALGQDLSLTLDQFYITYLRYALADRICAEFNYTTPVNVVKQLGKYEAFIDRKSRPLDLRMQKMSTLHKGSRLSWAQVNLGRGFTVG